MEDGNDSDSASTTASSVDTTLSDEADRVDGQGELFHSLPEYLVDDIAGAAGPAISAISLIAIFSKDCTMYLSIFTLACCRTFTISYKQML